MHTHAHTHTHTHTYIYKHILFYIYEEGLKCIEIEYSNYLNLQGWSELGYPSSNPEQGSLPST